MEAGTIIQDLSDADRRIFSDYKWRDRLTAVAHDALHRANQALPCVAQAWWSLCSKIPPGNGPDALRGFQKLIAVLEAFATRSHNQREILAGRIQFLEISDPRYHRNRHRLGEFLAELQEEVYNSSPELAAYWIEEKASQQEVAERQQRMADEVNKLRLARDKAKVDAPAVVRDLHERAVRPVLTADGGVHLFPASLMTEGDRVFVRDYGDILAEAIRAEMVVCAGKDMGR